VTSFLEWLTLISGFRLFPFSVTQPSRGVKLNKKEAIQPTLLFLSFLSPFLPSFLVRMPQNLFSSSIMLQQNKKECWLLEIFYNLD
jgi:hypothetical protein